MTMKMNLSFAGCGFLGIYHVGVAVCFKKYAPHLLLNKISGASAGAMAACCLLCDLQIGEVASDMLSVIREARRRTLGPFSPSFNVQEYLYEKLNKVLPEDAHLRVNGKLHISLTRVYDGQNVIVSKFSSKEDLLQALLASSFVPIFSGFIPPKFRGERYMDGGFSDNLPTLDENTIVVSPFCGESDICPRDYSTQLFHVNLANTSIQLSKQNIYRFARILWPPKPEVLSNMCKQGFDDALRFLHRNNLINCTRCLAVQSTFILSESIDESFEYDPQCQECKLHQEEAMVANLPDTIVRVFQDAIDSANKGLYNWMLSHRGMKLITLLSLPYTVPADFALATFKKVISVAPHMASSLFVMSRFVIEQLIQIIISLNKRRDYAPSSTYAHSSRYSSFGDSESSRFEKDMNFLLNADDSDLDITRTVPSRMLSRRSSFNGRGDIADDTYENILQVTTHNDAVMAFYYMDENNKVKVTEIFDVTDTNGLCSDDSNKSTSCSDWDQHFSAPWLHPNAMDTGLKNLYPEDDKLSEYSVEEEFPESGNILSDPEADWAPTEPTTSTQEMALHPSDHRPESDQLEQNCQNQQM